MSFSDARLRQLRREIRGVDPMETLAIQATGGVLVDVREESERHGSTAAGALRVGRGFLELRIEESVPSSQTPIVVMCAGGSRSLFAADDLRRLGYENVASMTGGYEAWKADGLPTEQGSTLSPEALERYARHIRMPAVGEGGQQALLQARVLVVGLGGLGSPAAMYLAAAGIGTLGLVDDDVVERSNLQRQIIHGEDTLGQLKVASAIGRLGTINPSVALVSHSVRITADNVDALVADYDIVIDGTDNFTARYLISDACARHRRPYIYGSVFQFEGEVGVFCADADGGALPCYRCLHPVETPSEIAPSCAEAGVLGVLPGIIGLFQALEVLKLLVGVGEPLAGKLLHYDASVCRFHAVRVPLAEDCDGCCDAGTVSGD